MICQQCGKKNDSDAVFCVQCSQPFKSDRRLYASEVHQHTAQIKIVYCAQDPEMGEFVLRRVDLELIPVTCYSSS